MPEVIQESVSVNGPRRLAGEMAYTLESPQAMCLLVNPHPYMGGRMDNNVIRCLSSVLSASGIATLRFDYTGVGSSEGAPLDSADAMAAFWRTGQAPVDPLMEEDAGSSLHWLQRQYDAPMFVVGYSFGAFVATRIAPAKCAGMILISPTVKHHDFTVSHLGHIPKLVIASDDDFATDAITLGRWFESLPPPKSEVRIQGGQHFFRGLEHEVARATLDFVNSVLVSRRAVH